MAKSTLSTVIKVMSSRSFSLLVLTFFLDKLRPPKLLISPYWQILLV